MPLQFAAAGSAFHGVVLAAGSGSRFGGRKMLALWRDEPIIVHSVRNALATPVRSVTVVLGQDATEAQEALRALAGPRLAIACNRDWRTGLASSLRTGLKALPEDAAGAVVLLGDMPQVPPQATTALLDALASGAPGTLAEVAGIPAHPVAFTRALFPQVCELTGDRGARALLASYPGIVRVSLDDPGCVFDIDVPDDVLAWRHGQSQAGC